MTNFLELFLSPNNLELSRILIQRKNIINSEKLFHEKIKGDLKKLIEMNIKIENCLFAFRYRIKEFKINLINVFKDFDISSNKYLTVVEVFNIKIFSLEIFFLNLTMFYLMMN